MRCGFCRAKCPTYDFIGWESGSPRGRMQQLYAIIQGRINPTSYVYDRLMKCTTCGYCEWRCPSGVKTTDAIEAGRAELQERGFKLEKHREAGVKIRETGNPYGYPRERKDLWKSEPSPSRRPTTLLFSGCTHPYTSPSALRDAYQVLRHFGVEVGSLGGMEPCCGSFLLRTGQRRLFEEYASKEMKALEDPHLEKIVTLCPGCYKTLSREVVPKFLNRDVRTSHFAPFIEELLDKTPNLGLKRIDLTVTYHDPCHLGRHMGIFEEPRKILESIPGIRLVEMAHNRNLAVCCGSGGGVRSAYPEMASEMAKLRLKEAAETGADLLVTSCPFCERGFRDALSESGGTPRVVDLAELLWMAVR
jgi:heterodisulfide reductase subunit D